MATSAVIPTYFSSGAGFKCTAEGLTLADPIVSGANQVDITYTGTASAVAAYDSAPIKLVCQSWQNPILPEVTTGFSIAAKDSSKTASLMATAAFSIDASTFAPYPMDPAIFTLNPDDATVQRPAAYTLAFTSPVPLQQSAAGCFLRLVFPDDFGFDQSSFTTFESIYNYPGYNRITPEFPSSIVNGDNGFQYADLGAPYSADFDTRTFVFKGC